MALTLFKDQLTRYQAVSVVCIGLSLGGIAVSVFVTKDPLDGSRGGVLAVGLAIINVLVRMDIAGEVLKRRQEKTNDREQKSPPPSAPPSEIQIVHQRLTDLDESLKDRSAEDKVMNYYLVVATAVGTIAATFGDILSGYLICQCGLHRLWCR